MNKCSVLACICMAVCLIWIYITAENYYYTRHYVDKCRYIMVLECHSSGSDVSMLRFQDSYPIVLSTEHIEVSVEMMLSHPYDSFNRTVEALSSFVERNAPKEQLSNSYMCVYFTKNINADKAKETEEGRRIVGLVRNQLELHLPLKFLDPLKDVRFLSVEDEVDYLWLTANYERGMFGKHANNSPPRPPSDLIGVINMEKTDVMLMFPYNGTIPGEEEQSKGTNTSVVSQTWFGKKYSLFKRKLPCLGIHSSFYSGKLAMIEKSLVPQELKFHTVGYNITKPPSKACMWFMEFMFPLFFPEKKLTIGKQLFVNIDGRYLPALTREMLVYANMRPKVKLHYKYNDHWFHYLKTQGYVPELNPAHFFDSSNMSHTCLTETYKYSNYRHPVDKKAVRTYCFEMYHTQFLLNYLGAPESWEGIHFYQKTDHAYVATGAVIAMYDRIPYGRYEYYTPWSVFLPTVVTSCACVVLLILALLCAQCRSSKKVVSNEQPA